MYVVGTGLLLPGARELSAALAAGRDCWVSHRSGGVVYRWLPEDGGVVDITVGGGGRKDRDGIRFHRSVCLIDADVGVYDGIPITSPARTLLDLATVLTRGELAWVYNEALIQRHTTPAEVGELLTRTHGHPGSRLLKAIVERDEHPQRADSHLERVVLEALRRGGVEEPRMGAVIGGWRVDFHWPRHRLVLEADGHELHSGPESWRRDRRKQADLEARGELVLRTDWEEASERPESLVGRVIRAQVERSCSANAATVAATAPAARKPSRGSTM